MNELHLGSAESRFADMIWEREPISSTELSKLAHDVFGWSKSTSYTVLKRLCDKGIFLNKGGEVRSVFSREDYYSKQSEYFVDESFDGSLPAFLAAFTRRRALKPEEIESIRRMIAEHKED